MHRYGPSRIARDSEHHQNKKVPLRKRGVAYGVFSKRVGTLLSLSIVLSVSKLSDNNATKPIASHFIRANV
ncbi:hypothetical protein QQP08_022683 [Theobroma cacao]|nr:hypothetical protein QQP08_022683 [Theobroma cacao]